MQIALGKDNMGTGKRKGNFFFFLAIGLVTSKIVK